MILVDEKQVVAGAVDEVVPVGLLIGRVHLGDVVLALQVGQEEVPRVVHELLELDVIEERVDAVQHLKVVEIIGNAKFLL